jgi:hypothetical protein
MAQLYIRLLTTGAPVWSTRPPQPAGLDERPAPHWLRHAHATLALERGAPIHLVQAMLARQRGNDWSVSPRTAVRQLGAQHVGLRRSLR